MEIFGLNVNVHGVGLDVLIATSLIVAVAGYILLRRGGRNRWSAVYGAVLLFSLIFSIWLFLVWALQFFFHIEVERTAGYIGLAMPLIAARLFWIHIRPLL